MLTENNIRHSLACCWKEREREKGRKEAGRERDRPTYVLRGNMIIVNEKTPGARMETEIGFGVSKGEGPTL